MDTSEAVPTPPQPGSSLPPVPADVGERRAARRHHLVVPGQLAGRDVTVVELSVDGARVRCHLDDVPAIGPPLALHVDLGDGLIDGYATVRWVHGEGEAVTLGLRFVPGQRDVRARLHLALDLQPTTPDVDALTPRSGPAPR